jgi:diguanylate cyclase (GGDEF)-like protein
LSLGSWSTHQLTEFLAVISASQEEAEATRGAVERAAEALEAEFGAILRDGEVVASVGFPRNEAPAAELAAIAAGETETLDVAGLGVCQTAVVPYGEEPNGRLVLARLGDDPFDREDLNLLRGMSRVVTLTLRLLRMVEDERALRKESGRLLRSLQEREMLLEQLSQLQHRISTGARAGEVLEAVADGAAALVAADIVDVRLIAPDDPSELVVAASRGVDPDLARRIRRIPIAAGTAGRAIASGRLVWVENYQDFGGLRGATALAATGAHTVMAVPLYEHSSIVGALIVASCDPERHFSESEREMVAAYAEQASIALAAARAVDGMRQAYSDSLTGLPNRALLLDRMEATRARAEREQESMTVLFLDLDGFKPVNDSLGHLAGDRLLVEVARRVRGCLRRGDTAARLGGDEFAVLLADLGDVRRAERIARRILLALAEPFTLLGKEVFVTASVGIASGLDDPEDLLRNADVAMYRVKREGKNGFRLFEPDMHTAVLERLELEADLRKAIEREELVLHFQPVVDLDDGAVVGVEALVRWHHPTRGLLMPLDFIPLAEETGLIVDVGRWVLATACRQVVAWQRALGSAAPDWISVNLSGRDLLEEELDRGVAAALEESGLDPARLTLEITETVIVQDGGRALAQLERLKELGVRLAIDDFGTGYSSLRYLGRFPVDVLKVAKPFVDGVLDDRDAALVRTVVSLAESLHLSTVAEGIEHAEQRERLVELGCTLGQGYLFARPLPVETLEPVLREHASLAA